MGDLSAIFQQATQVILAMMLIVLLPGLLAGLLVSIFQAATQINEQTLSFIPKLVVTIVTLMVTGSWLLSLLMDFTRRLFDTIPFVIG
ncbi:MAG TPA: flagellar biosynthesis protein FliQ [Gammaproteobacteria bacterium]|nr:flagellar biosynthesis protein FliQ [Gammaproteobacteria bacterium]